MQDGNANASRAGAPVRLIFSRKGFDSSAGGSPSPILAGQVISLPIPTSSRSQTCFADRGLAELVADLTGGRLTGRHLCHFDPDLEAGALGQVGSAQSHLARQGVGVGDVFLFFGLFREAERVAGRYRFRPGARPHHRLFGWLQVGEVIHLGEDGTEAGRRLPRLSQHPHFSAGWNSNNTAYVGSERLALGSRASGLPGFGLLPSPRDELRLSAMSGALPSMWSVPRWLNPLTGGVGLTYHSKMARWTETSLQAVGRGQEFVADVGDRADAREWIESIITAGTS
jgi:hypothetical protein